MKRRSGFLLLLSVLIATMVGCQKSGHNAEESKDAEVVRGLVSDIEKEGETLESDITVIKEEPYKPLEVNAANMKDLHFIARWDDVSYQITNAVITKSIQNRDKSKIHFWREKTDKTGNLIGDQVYVWITLKITNQAEQQTEVYLNNPLYSIDESYTIKGGVMAEARYISRQYEGMSETQTFHWILQPGEEQEIEIGYIMDEAFLAYPMYYTVGVYGSSDNTYLSLEDAEYEM